MIYKLYTDGATSKNGYEGAYGGCGWAIITNDELIAAGQQPIKEGATNNICELKGMINGCKVVMQDLEPFDMVLVYSDSAYIINCYKQGWYKAWEKNGWVNSKKQPVANKELWEELIPFFENPNFKFEKVVGHSGDKWNDYVDKLAVEAKNGKSGNYKWSPEERKGYFRKFLFEGTEGLR